MAEEQQQQGGEQQGGTQGQQGEQGKTVLDAGQQDAGAQGRQAEDQGQQGDQGGGEKIWPDDWQKRLSKGDTKLEKRLARYASPEAVADALIAAQNRISSGELKTVLPKDAKPEEIAQWRKDNGIPDAPEKYDLTFQNGLVIGEKDKPIVDGFLKSAHAANMAPEHVKTAVQWYYQEQERQAEERAKQDDTERLASLDSLNAEWGGAFRRNVNMVNGLLSRFPEAVRDALKSARLPDGRGVFNDVDVMRGFAALALELNPAGVVVPSGQGDVAKTMDDEIKQIEAKMGTKEYTKDEKVQARLRELYDARESMAQRKAA